MKIQIYSAIEKENRQNGNERIVKKRLQYVGSVESEEEAEAVFERYCWKRRSTGRGRIYVTRGNREATIDRPFREVEKKSRWRRSDGLQENYGEKEVRRELIVFYELE